MLLLPHATASHSLLVLFFHSVLVYITRDSWLNQRLRSFSTVTTDIARKPSNTLLLPRQHNMRFQHLSALLLGGLATASPLAIRQAGTATRSGPCTRSTPPAAGSGSESGSGSGVDAAAILAIIPGSNSCAGAQFPDECRTAEQAAPFISKACAELSKAECAATIALMGYESGIKVKHNLTPGVPGQGTANMMSPTVSLP